MTMYCVVELTILLLASFDDWWRTTTIMWDLRVKILTQFTIGKVCKKSLYVHSDTSTESMTGSTTCIICSYKQ